MTGAKEELVPLQPGRIGIYVCGITVYDYCHIGHGRMLVVFDMVVRYLRSLGYIVTFVRNITDIEDKIIKRAAENNEPIDALTARFIRAMDEDCAALGMLKPDHEPRATQHGEIKSGAGGPILSCLPIVSQIQRDRVFYKYLNRKESFHQGIYSILSVYQ